MAKEVKIVNCDNVEIRVTIDGKRKSYETEEGFELYPMDITTVNPADYARMGLIPELITYRLVGEKSRLSYMVPVPTDQYRPMIAYDKAEDKRQERQRKCRVPGKNGSLIICRQASCRKAQEKGLCPNCGKLDIQVNTTVSLDELMEDANWEPGTSDITAETANAHMMEEGFKEYLDAHNPRLRKIYEEQAIGFTVSDMVNTHKFNSNTAYKDRQRIMDLAKEYFGDF